jgi:flavin-binding protein dodecin
MAEGSHPKTGQPDLNPAWKGNHSKGFDAALQDALDKWSDTATQDQVLKVTSFSVKATKNPGGVKEYHVTIAP